MRLGEAASESTLAADSPAASFGRSAAGSDLPPRFPGIATWPRAGASVARSAGLRGPAGATPLALDEAGKGLVAAKRIRRIRQPDEAERPRRRKACRGFASEAEGCRG